jgi:DNA primase
VDFRVVRLPRGTDPADVVQRDGADAMRGLLESAVPLPRYEVERALERGDTATTGGRDRVLEEAAAAIAAVPVNTILHTELVKFAADRLNVAPSLVEAATGDAARRPTAPARPAGGRAVAAETRTNGARHALDRREQTERAFLALCLALPDEGERRLAEADLDTLFSSPDSRRAADYLRGRLRTPAADLPAGDEPLARLVAELVIRAGQLEATPGKLELEALQLDLSRLDRLIAGARVDGPAAVHDLAAERQRVLDAIRHRLT